MTTASRNMYFICRLTFRNNYQEVLANYKEAEKVNRKRRDEDEGCS